MWHAIRHTRRRVPTSPTYEPRMSSQGVVYQVVRHHFESFRAQAAGLRDGEGLPRFVEQAASRAALGEHAVASAEAGVFARC